MNTTVFSDVEGTLIDGSLPQLSLLIGRELGIFSPWQLMWVQVFGLATAILPARLHKKVQLLSTLPAMAGQTEGNVHRLIEAVVPLCMEQLKSEMYARLCEHLEEGLPLVLLSAGLHEAIVRIGTELGGRGEGTKLIVRNGYYTMRPDGAICQGKGKALRARAILTEMGYDPASSYAYGDTSGDIPFLSLFGHPCAVDPDAGLAAEAQRRGWPIRWETKVIATVKGNRP
jgi:phosphoserine phosphatase